MEVGEEGDWGRKKDNENWPQYQYNIRGTQACGKNGDGRGENAFVPSSRILSTKRFTVPCPVSSHSC